WIATGVEVAQVSLWFGVDDLDGTVQEERIYHMAGARTPEAMTPQEIRRLVRAAGREPLERDTFYNVLEPASARRSAVVQSSVFSTAVVQVSKLHHGRGAVFRLQHRRSAGLQACFQFRPKSEPEARSRRAL